MENMRKERIKQNVCYLTGFLFLCLILYSCLQDESDWGSDTADKVVLGKNRELTVDVAQSWYEANQAPVVTTRSVATNVELMTKLHWKKAFECSRGRFEVVEIPLLAKGGAVLMDHETMEKSSSEEVRGKIRNISRMVIIKNLETGETINFVMHIVGTFDYLMTAKHFENNSYLNRDPHLSGSVYFYKPEGGFVNGWSYKDGKIVAKISQGTEIGLQMQTEAKTRAILTSCHPEPIFVEHNVCSPYDYYDPEYGLGIGIECRKVVKSEIVEVCNNTYYDKDGNAHLWEPDTGNGGVGGGGGYQPTIAPKAKAIFRNSNMTEANWKALEKLLNKITENCMGSELYNGLANVLDGKTFSIQFNSGTSSSFGTQKDGSIGISLGSNLESGQLLHEMFHAFRSYKEGSISSYESSKMNGEVEAHYAQYLYQRSLPEYQTAGNKWARRDKTNYRWKSIKSLNSVIDEHGKLRSGFSEEDLKSRINSDIVPALINGGYSPEQYPFDYSRPGLENFSCLIELTIKC